jgi:effector-binding domain-containing protein
VIDVTIVESPPTPTAVIREVTSWDAFPQLWPRLLDEVWRFVRGAGIPAGRNVMLYRDNRPLVEVGVEVEAAFEPNGRVVASSLPTGPAATTLARGELTPRLIADAHAAVRSWCEEFGHEVTGERWEVYGHWRDDQDPAAYELEVYWRLARSEARSE